MNENRKVLTRWPDPSEPKPEGRWNWVFDERDADWHGSFIAEGSEIMFVREATGSRWFCGDFEPGERFEPIPDEVSPAVEVLVNERAMEILREVADLLGVPLEGVPEKVREMMAPVETLEAVRSAHEDRHDQTHEENQDNINGALDYWSSAGYPGTKGGRRG